MNDMLNHACKDGWHGLGKVTLGRGKCLNNSPSVRLLLAAGSWKGDLGVVALCTLSFPREGGATFSLVLFQGIALE